MKYLAYFLLIFIMVSCRTVLPPERPVAYMYPTVCPAAILSEMHPAKITRQELRDALSDMNLIADIDNSGMLSTDLAVILRSLTKRGYAEIDARRSKLPWQWISLSVPAENTLQVVCGFRKFPSKKYTSIDVQQKPNQTGYRYGANGVAQPIQIWTAPTYSIAQIMQPNSAKPSHWEMIQIFSLEQEK